MAPFLITGNGTKFVPTGLARGNFLVRRAFKSDNQPGTVTCKRTQRKTCPFISNTVKITGPNLSAKVTDNFTCISPNVIYCITCPLCKIYKDASKPVACHSNLPNNSHHNMTICRLSLNHMNTESHKNLEQNFIFQLGTLSQKYKRKIKKSKKNKRQG